METKRKHWALRLIKWVAISIVSLLFLMFLLPILFPGQVAEQVKKLANERLDGELNFSRVELSFFTQFPSLTVTLYDFELKGSQPFNDEKLVTADAVGFGINLNDLVFGGEVTVNELFVDGSEINVLVDEQGRANYNVYISDDEVEVSKDSASGASLRLNKIQITQCNLRYEDRSLPMLIEAKDFNYTGKGNLDEAVFDLETHAQIGAFDFTFAGEKYFEQKKVNAKLLTQINTNALQFAFRQNELTINSLPVNFIGEFHILQSGYYMDFNLRSDNAPLRSVFTAMPPNYVKWVDRSEVRGAIDLFFQLKGRYEVESNRQPNVVFQSKIREGYIAYKEAENAMRDLTLDLDVQLPSLHTDSLAVHLKQFYFAVGERHFKAEGEVKGLNKPEIHAKANGFLDLEQLGKSVGLTDYQLRGLLKMDAQLDGVLDIAQNQFPKTNGLLSMENARIQTPHYPAAIENLALRVEMKNTTGNYSDTYVELKPLRFEFEGEPFYASGYFENPGNVSYDLEAKGVLNLTKIARVFAPDGVGIHGRVKADLALKGTQADVLNNRLDRLQNRGSLEADSIQLRLAMLPQPMWLDHGFFRFNQDQMQFENFQARYGSSQLQAKGYLKDAIGYVFNPKSTLKGTFTLSLDRMVAEEWMPVAEVPLVAADTLTLQPEKVAVTTTSPNVFAIPERIDLLLHANVGEIKWQDIVLQQTRGQLVLKDEQAILRNLRLLVIDAPMQLDGSYRALSPTEAEFAMHYKGEQFDIQRAYNEIALFREMASAAEYAKGIVGMDYHLKGKLNAEMLPIFPTLKGEGDIVLKDIQVAGMKMFTRMKDKTDIEALNNPNIKDVVVHSTIANNVITIDRTKMNLGAFRLRFEGKTNFDGAMSFQMRIGLPPFGLIGIPVAVNGTHANPEVKIFSKKSEDVPEKGYGKEADEAYEKYLAEQAALQAAQQPTDGSPTPNTENHE